MKLDYATPEANTTRRQQACHPAVAVAGVVFYGLLTSLIGMWIVNSIGVSWETFGVVPVILLTFFGWRTVAAARCLRRKRRQDSN